jgi:hypothetical protein
MAKKHRQHRKVAQRQRFAETYKQRQFTRFTQKGGRQQRDSITIVEDHPSLDKSLAALKSNDNFIGKRNGKASRLKRHQQRPTLRHANANQPSLSDRHPVYFMDILGSTVEVRGTVVEVRPEMFLLRPAVILPAATASTTATPLQQEVDHMWLHMCDSVKEIGLGETIAVRGVLQYYDHSGQFKVGLQTPFDLLRHMKPVRTTLRI